MKLSIIIPVFNEERTIKEILSKVNKVRLPFNLKKEIIVINDGSTDNTTKILKRNIIGIKVVSHEKNLGKGAALRTGFKNASGEFIIIQDADLEYNPQDFNELINPLLTGKAQVVYGSRFINYPLILWGKNKTPLPSHWLGNKFLTMLTNVLYGSKITDMETCYKVFKKEVLDNLNLKSSRFEIEPEITSQILKKGFKIFEVPIKINPRSHKEGKKITWKDGAQAMITLIKYKLIK